MRSIPFTLMFRWNARVLRCAFLAGAWSICGLALGQGSSSALDETDTRAVTKANFLFHFAASNEWPASVKEGEFHLTIVGNERLHAELVDKYAMKMIGAQPLRVHGYARPVDLPLDGFHHLVYCDFGGAELNRIAAALEDTPAVLVSDSPDGLEQGAVINFVASGNRIRYEINAADAAKKGVLIGNKIMSWAVK
ncbi:MAG: YfiR family protein [Flavobacteriales bacterium]